VVKPGRGLRGGVDYRNISVEDYYEKACKDWYRRSERGRLRKIRREYSRSESLEQLNSEHQLENFVQ
jgi:hypothetical protein